MKISKLFFPLIFSILFFNFGEAQAQTRKELEITRKKLKQEIVKVNKLLFAAKKKGKNALDSSLRMDLKA